MSAAAQDPFTKLMESEGISFPEAVERLAKANGVLPGNDQMLEALLLAEEFVAQELENREAAGEGEYVEEARAVLAVITEALRI